VIMVFSLADVVYICHYNFLAAMCQQI
jgi:hypothetical protein